MDFLPVRSVFLAHASAYVDESFLSTGRRRSWLYVGGGEEGIHFRATLTLSMYPSDHPIYPNLAFFGTEGTLEQMHDVGPKFVEDAKIRLLCEV